MKIPEAAAPSYYGEEAHWQGNGMAETAGPGQYSGVTGAIPTPIYPPQIRGHMPPAAYMPAVVSGGYFGVFPAPVPGGPQPQTLSPPNPPTGQDFSEYMWMENEEEFDKQVMQQLEEEALMEQCIEAMLEDERERLHIVRHNGRHTNGMEIREVSKSTLNPLAAEFVPGGGSFCPAMGASTTVPGPPSPPIVSAQDNIKPSLPIAPVDDPPAEPKPESPCEETDLLEKAPSEIASDISDDKIVETPKCQESESADSKIEEPAPVAEQETKDMSQSPVESDRPQAPGKMHRDSTSKEAKQSKPKPTLADVVGGPKKGDRSKSTKANATAAKGKDGKQGKNEPKLEQKRKESPQPPAQDKTVKEDITVCQQQLENVSSINAQSSVPKPINYAAAAKARVQPRK